MAAPTANCNSADAADAVSAGSKRSFPGVTAAHSDRRVQPRHFHAGASAAAAAASSSGDDADASDHPPPAARLYRHALESIFAFLDQLELVAVLQVSHSWLAAVKSMASLRLTIRKPSAPLRVVAESVMGRHVTQLGEDKSHVQFDVDSLVIAARLMPQLCELNCELKLSPSPCALSFPPGLRKLNLVIGYNSATANVNATLESVGRLPLLETFILNLFDINDELSFAPLASLRLLRLFRIFASYAVDLSDAHVSELRALPLLEQLDVQPTSMSLLRRLLAQPHDLQWKQISLPDPVDDEAAGLLPQLPSLAHFGDTVSGVTLVVACSRFDFLRQLPNLTHVNVEMISELSVAGSIESLVTTLQCCSQIQALELNSQELTNAQLAELLPRLPRLRELSLGNSDITTLSFLAQEPMTRQLASLQLSYCPRLPLTELRHVHALEGLRMLQLHRSFDSPMDTLCQSLYTPPSPLMPQLERFMYEKP